MSCIANMPGMSIYEILQILSYSREVREALMSFECPIFDSSATIMARESFPMLISISRLSH